jgi:hypothetical protein
VGLPGDSPHERSSDAFFAFEFDLIRDTSWTSVRGEGGGGEVEWEEDTSSSLAFIDARCDFMLVLLIFFSPQSFMAAISWSILISSSKTVKMRV